MLRWGTTTVEAKSGYGLSAQSEVKILEIIRELDRTHPVDLVPTFLGAHDYPEEFASDHDGYLRVLTEVMIPLVANAGLAEFCDVFCDQGFFSAEESEQVLACGSKLGLRPKLHADELTSAGGAELAGRIGAVSADHVLHPSEEGLAAMRARAVVAVLLPGTSLSLRSGRYAPARRMIEMGIPVALGTDLNPGTCTIESLPLIIGLSCLQMGLTPAEAITASTINAAWAVGRGDRIGSLEPGKQADVLVLDVPNYRMIAYQFSVAHTELVIKRGTVAYAR
jgi:imidazolonepropionase